MKQLRKYINLIESFISEADIVSNDMDLINDPNAYHKTRVDFGQFNTKDEDIKIIVNKLKTECSEIVEIYKNINQFIYRGVNSKHNIFYQEIRKDRQPSFLNSPLHDAFNVALTSRGFAAHRGNSIFTSANLKIAQSWGWAVYVVFPLNGFQYTWFENADSFGYVYDDIKAKWRNNTDKNINDMMNELVDDLEPKNNDLALAISRNAEILITGKGYYGIKYSDFFQYFLDSRGILI